MSREIMSDQQRVFFRLRDLTHSEIQPLVHQLGILPEHCPSVVNGRILASISKVEQLLQFKIEGSLFQESALDQINEWKTAGVPYQSVRTSENSVAMKSSALLSHSQSSSSSTSLIVPGSRLNSQETVISESSGGEDDADPIDKADANDCVALRKIAQRLKKQVASLKRTLSERETELLNAKTEIVLLNRSMSDLQEQLIEAHTADNPPIVTMNSPPPRKVNAKPAAAAAAPIGSKAAKAPVTQPAAPSSSSTQPAAAQSSAKTAPAPKKQQQAAQTAATSKPTLTNSANSSSAVAPSVTSRMGLSGDQIRAAAAATKSTSSSSSAATSRSASTATTAATSEAPAVRTPTTWVRSGQALVVRSDLPPPRTTAASAPALDRLLFTVQAVDDSEEDDLDEGEFGAYGEYGDGLGGYVLSEEEHQEDSDPTARHGSHDSAHPRSSSSSAAVRSRAIQESKSNDEEEEEEVAVQQKLTLVPKKRPREKASPNSSSAKPRSHASKAATAVKKQKTVNSYFPGDASLKGQVFAVYDSDEEREQAAAAHMAATFGKELQLAERLEAAARVVASSQSAEAQRRAIDVFHKLFERRQKEKVPMALIEESGVAACLLQLVNVENHAQPIEESLLLDALVLLNDIISDSAAPAIAALLDLEIVPVMMAHLTGRGVAGKAAQHQAVWILQNLQAEDEHHRRVIVDAGFAETLLQLLVQPGVTLALMAKAAEALRTIFVAQELHALLVDIAEHDVHIIVDVLRALFRCNMHAGEKKTQEAVLRDACALMDSVGELLSKEADEEVEDVLLLSDLPRELLRLLGGEAKGVNQDTCMRLLYSLYFFCGAMRTERHVDRILDFAPVPVLAVVLARFKPTKKHDFILFACGALSHLAAFCHMAPSVMEDVTTGGGDLRDLPRALIDLVTVPKTPEIAIVAAATMLNVLEHCDKRQGGIWVARGALAAICSLLTSSVERLGSKKPSDRESAEATEATAKKAIKVVHRLITLGTATVERVRGVVEDSLCWAALRSFADCDDQEVRNALSAIGDQ